MTKATTLFRRHAMRLVALAIVLALYPFARLPEASSTERAALSARFHFAGMTLPEVPGARHRSVRTVSPSLERISAWISSVGASVALNDLDGDGLPNDVCYVDPRTDQVIIAPVPGTSARYEPFALDPAPLPYDPATMAPTGCLPSDMNEDGLTDILVYYWGRTPVASLRRDSAGSLRGDSYVSQELVGTGERWYTNAGTMADLDGDGHVDLVLGNYFEDGARILDASSSSREHMQHSMSRAYDGGRNRLLLWSGSDTGVEPSVQFREVEGVLEDRVARGWTLAVGAADLDGDLLPELYFANDFGPDRLLHNRSTPGRLSFNPLEGRKALTTPNSKVLGQDSFKGMGVDFGDLNDDGLLDIYVSNIAAEYALEESHFTFLSTGELEAMRDGVAPYVDRSESLGLSRSGWGWDARLGDFDNDGVLEALQATGFVRGEVNRWPELHELAMGNDEVLRDPRSWPRFQPGDDLSGRDHNPFFVRGERGRYVDVARDVGLENPQVSRGIATADADGDGDLDIAVANQWDVSQFYINEGPDLGTFLGLHLRLPVQREDGAGIAARPGHLPLGRPAIGATAIVHLPDGRRLTMQVDGGSGHSGKRSPDLHFGLGDHSPDTPIQVELRWRDGSGRIQQEALHLSPGWHTVILNSQGVTDD